MKTKYLYAALVAAGCLGLSSVQASTINVVGPTSFQLGTDTTFDLDIVGNDLLEGPNAANTLDFYTAGGGIHIDFDPAVLNVNATSFDQFGTNIFATIIWDFVRQASFDNVLGTIDLAVGRIGNPGSLPASQVIASLRFDIVGAGNTTLDLSGDTTGTFGNFTYSADSIPPPPSGVQTTIAAEYCIDGIQTYDAASMPTCGHGALDGTPALYLTDTVISVAGIPAVPVPAAVWLFGSGLIGLVGVARRKTVLA